MDWKLFCRHSVDLWQTDVVTGTLFWVDVGLKINEIKSKFKYLRSIETFMDLNVGILYLKFGWLGEKDIKNVHYGEAPTKIYRHDYFCIISIN